MQPDQLPIRKALISVYHKEGLDEVAVLLQQHSITVFSTGGTLSYLQQHGVECVAVDELTQSPEMLGGRVKTLHPKVFGGILFRGDNEADLQDVAEHGLPEIDLVVVDLYPFLETLQSGADDAAIVEKIDIGGISLIRAAAKNHKRVAIVSHKGQYGQLRSMLEGQVPATSLAQRRSLAAEAFATSAAYDAAIAGWAANSQQVRPMRYGENPHQKAWFQGDLEKAFHQHSGKEISFNNLVDIDAAIQLMDEFDRPAAVVIKHTNPCGVAEAEDILDAWKRALASDPVSVFGGIIAVNRQVDEALADEMHNLFFEVLVAPGYTDGALQKLSSKKNRILLQRNPGFVPDTRVGKTLLGGTLVQDADNILFDETKLEYPTAQRPTAQQWNDLVFAFKIVKHAKSNAIVAAHNSQLIGIGQGQTSRIDALNQAIAKAKAFNFDVNGAALASDAFFPFSDSVEAAHNAGIASIIQPGGSIRDEESIALADRHNISMVFTHFRHFKH